MLGHNLVDRPAKFGIMDTAIPICNPLDLEKNARLIIYQSWKKIGETETKNFMRSRWILSTGAVME